MSDFSIEFNELVEDLMYECNYSRKEAERAAKDIILRDINEAF